MLIACGASLEFEDFFFEARAYDDLMFGRGLASEKSEEEFWEMVLGGWG